MISKRRMRTICLCSISALLASAALCAQAPGGAPQQPSMPSQQSPQTPNPNMQNPGANPGAAPNGENYADQAFITKALQGGLTEVQLGQLAQQKAQSEDVKQFGQKMVNEHSQMADKWFKPVATQIGASEPKGPSKKDKKLIEKLQGLSGSQFDTAYIQAMVKDHKEDLKDFQSEAQAAQNPNVKQVAQQGSSIISQHLQLIEQIAQKNNVPVEGAVGNVSSNR